MQTFLVVRRSAWPSEEAQREADGRSAAEATRMAGDSACIYSYVLEECDRTLGSVCIVEASSPEAVRRHAAAADLPVDEIVKVAAAGVWAAVRRHEPRPVRRPEHQRVDAARVGLQAEPGRHVRSLEHTRQLLTR
jgi:hypothetical protein